MDAAGVGAGKLAVDLGAGTGILTRELARRGARVLAVEADPQLAAGLRDRFSGVPSVRVLEADARRLPWPDERFTVVANLPFSGASAILHALLDDPRVPLTRAELILQWEAAAKRASSWPSTLAGVYWGAWYELRLERRLAAAAFAPPPSVAAGVLGIERRREPLVPPGEAAAYRRLLAHAFRDSPPLRSALPRPLRGRPFKRLALELGFADDARARDLDARQWSVLFRAVRSARYAPPPHAPL